MAAEVQSPRRAPLFEVLACVPARAAELPALVASLDGDALVRAAARHGLAALLADALAAAKVVLPEPARTDLARAARAQIAQGQRMKRATLRVLDALATEGLTPTMLKGAGLAQRLYPEQPLARPSSDIDLLVTEAELPGARRALLALGLEETPDVSLANVFEEHHHLSFAGPLALVELHFRLLSEVGAGTFDEAGPRNRRERGAFEGRPVWWLGAEDELVYLAVHAANHSFLRASWLMDLARYVQANPGLRWDVMAQRCQEAGFFSAVAAAFFLVEQLLGVTLPAAAAAAFRPGLLRRAGHRIAFAPAHVETADWSSHRVGAVALRLWLVDSPRHGLRQGVNGIRRVLRRRQARVT